MFFLVAKESLHWEWYMMDVYYIYLINRPIFRCFFFSQQNEHDSKITILYSTGGDTNHLGWFDDPPNRDVEGA